jgi:alanine dehydrogenase
MNIGIPREAGHGERRVGLSPGGVEALVADGHRVYVQSHVGEDKGFADLDYAAAGAQVVRTAEETIRKSTLILSIGPPNQNVLSFLGSQHVWAGYLHLAVAPVTLLDGLLEKRMTLIDYQTIETDVGIHPAQNPVSEVAGRMSVHVAAMLLQNDEEGPCHACTYGKGLGMLLGGVPGVPPADVVIVGGGVVGTNAARGFAGLGAQVTLLDNDVEVLKSIDYEFRGQVVTMAAHAQNLRKAVSFADVLIGCVVIPGGRAPKIITREMVRSMRPGSVVLDISIDQGGSVETSRLTSLREPTFLEEGVIHYCVPNMASAVGRTATYAITNAVLPFIEALATHGVAEATRRDTVLSRGVNIYRGHLTNPHVAASFHRRYEPLSSLLEQEARRNISESSRKGRTG